ncbi:MAG: chromosome assembly protein, partial [Thermodesulfobacteriota bacterium]|nr:chromosome assembly protein [Thermodesulfobacteriota bacterium]
MGIKDIISMFRKNPVDKLKLSELQEEELKLKSRINRIRKEIDKVEKDKKNKFQEGVGADLIK